MFEYILFILGVATGIALLFIKDYYFTRPKSRQYIEEGWNRESRYLSGQGSTEHRQFYHQKLDDDITEILERLRKLEEK